MTTSLQDGKTIKSQVENSIESQVENSIESQVKKDIESQVKKDIESQVKKDIESQVKKNTEIKIFDTKNVEEWIKIYVSFKPSANTSLKKCYEAYKKYLEFEKKVVPLTKKSFSGLFRKLLKKNEDKGQVRFYKRSSILIKGV